MLFAEHLAAQGHGIEEDLQPEAERNADQDLLDGDQHARARQRRHVGTRQRAARSSVDGPGQHHPDARRHRAAPNSRRDHEAGADAHERPEELEQPASELSCRMVIMVCGRGSSVDEARDALEQLARVVTSIFSIQGPS